MSPVSGRPLAVAMVAFLLAPAAAVQAQDTDADRAAATHLADMLRAGRTVVSSQQSLINDPTLGDKGFTGDELVSEAGAIFAQQYGVPPEQLDLTERDRRLLDSLIQAMHTVVEESQEDINQEGVGFKGFIPAIFGRLTTEQFAELAGNEARIRLTAPPDFVRNRKARPDAWEEEIIETRLMQEDWPAGEPVEAETEVDGRPAFRIMFPEYYRESCLECHGTPKGEVDITGYPKEGGEVGDLGSVISITIFR